MQRRVIGAWIYGCDILADIDLGALGSWLARLGAGAPHPWSDHLAAARHRRSARARASNAGGAGAYGDWAAIFVFVLVGGVIPLLKPTRRPRQEQCQRRSLRKCLTRAPSLSGVADWPAYGGTDKRAALFPAGPDQPRNVDALQRAWTYRTGDLPDERWGAETTPLKIGDTLFLCSARNIYRGGRAIGSRALALRSASGRREYSLYRRMPRRRLLHHPEGHNRQACAARIIEGTLDGRLIAVDARTGTPCGFGDNGEVDITQGMGDTPPGMVSITSAPTMCAASS